MLVLKAGLVAKTLLKIQETDTRKLMLRELLSAQAQVNHQANGLDQIRPNMLLLELDLKTSKVQAALPNRLNLFPNSSVHRVAQAQLAIKISNY